MGFLNTSRPGFYLAILYMYATGFDWWYFLIPLLPPWSNPKWWTLGSFCWRVENKIHCFVLTILEGKGGQRKKGPLFNPCFQTTKNTGILLVCSECSKPRLLHSKNKAKRDDLLLLNSMMKLCTYGCGAVLQDTDVKSAISEKNFVCANMVCNVEKILLLSRQYKL